MVQAYLTKDELDRQQFSSAQIAWLFEQVNSQSKGTKITIQFEDALGNKQPTCVAFLN